MRAQQTDFDEDVENLKGKVLHIEENYYIQKMEAFMHKIKIDILMM